ncbi:MAG: Gfo/Idh/MocA family oxidoreductase [Coleofasciculaceae cyanobacterium]
MAIINWGILGTGVIANKFAKGLKSVPSSKLLAIASRKIEKAHFFAEKHKVPKTYGSYEKLVLDNDIDVVYIATPNIFHKENAILCLENNKHVLCEKPFAMNEKQAQEVIELASKKKLFCMEAMWARFMPIIERAKLIAESGQIGEIKLFSASFGKLNDFDPLNNFYNPKLGGGSLLDMGVYPISLALYFLGYPSEVKGFLSLGETGIDEQASILLKFPTGTQAVLTSNCKVNYSNEIKIYGSKGVMTIHEPIYRSSGLTINKYEYTNNFFKKILLKIREKYFGYVIRMPVKSNGYNYEAHEVVNCLNENKIESKTMPLQDSLMTLKVIDEIRREEGFEYEF